MPEAGEFLTFKKSSRSAADCACVEVARSPLLVAVRDSKTASGPVLRFAPRSWSAFIADVRSGRLG